MTRTELSDSFNANFTEDLSATESSESTLGPESELAIIEQLARSRSMPATTKKKIEEFEAEWDIDVLELTRDDSRLDQILEELMDDE